MASVNTIQDKSYHILKTGNVMSPKGYKAGGLYCGLKNKKLDFGWLYSEVPAEAAGVFTTNLFQAAPLQVTRDSLSVENKIQAIVVNSGNANACTGEQGLQDAYSMRKSLANHIGVKEHHVSVVSTGVIGVSMPMDKIQKGIESISLTEVNPDSFESAILTTDTCTKHVAVELTIDGKTVTIGGAAKGSGMIHPNMATMLGFVTTDAQIPSEALSLALKQITNETFNMITVDGDTSTNDMVLLLANGLAGNEDLTPDHIAWPEFVEALNYVCESLAKQIARDGEGATKLVEVQVKGAATVETAKIISKKIVGSSLVKTAIYGADPNWGRIICAVGYSEQPIDPAKLSLKIGPISVVEGGLPVPFSEEDATTYLEEENIQISVDLGQGEASAIAWGCDLTYDYVKINASYRT